MPNLNDLLTVPQAAKLRGLTSPRWLLTLIHDGRLPATRIGGRWLIRRQDLDRLQVGDKGWPRDAARRRWDARRAAEDKAG